MIDSGKDYKLRPKNTTKGTTLNTYLLTWKPDEWGYEGLKNELTPSLQVKPRSAGVAETSNQFTVVELAANKALLSDNFSAMFKNPPVAAFNICFLQSSNCYRQNAQRIQMDRTVTAQHCRSNEQ